MPGCSTIVWGERYNFLSIHEYLLLVHYKYCETVLCIYYKSVIFLTCCCCLSCVLQLKNLTGMNQRRWCALYLTSTNPDRLACHMSWRSVFFLLLFLFHCISQRVLDFFKRKLLLDRCRWCNFVLTCRTVASSVIVSLTVQSPLFSSDCFFLFYKGTPKLYFCC